MTLPDALTASPNAFITIRPYAFTASPNAFITIRPYAFTASPDAVVTSSPAGAGVTMAPPKFVEGIQLPRSRTCEEYGLTLETWQHIAARQGWACGVCHKKPKNKRLVVDHVHISGWRRMPPEVRRRYVRGLCCMSCNHFVLTRYADALKHRQAAEYLEDFERRFNASETP